METTPALDLALSGDRVRFFLCGQADLPDHTARLLEASGEVTWVQGTFTGSDALLGSLEAIEVIQDGIGDQAPQLTVKFLPNKDADAIEICSPDLQGSRIRIWLGALNELGVVIDDPYLMFDGELDQPTLKIDYGKRELSYDCVSSFEKLFMLDEGNRLNSAHHKEVWPGETGLDDVTGVSRSIIWGPGYNPDSNNPFSGAGGFVGGLLEQVFNQSQSFK